MSLRPVRVHSCQRASRESGPLDCRCQRHVTKNRAKEFVREGLAVFRTFPSGRLNDLEIALLKYGPMPPARTIDATAIENAYVGGKVYERQRIEMYRKEAGNMKERALLRKRAALTQQQLANLTGIAAPRICLWERGEIELRPEQIERIAAVLRGRLAETPVFENVQELHQSLAPATAA